MKSTTTKTTLKRLFSVSGNRCAFPACDVALVDPISGDLIGEVCHINGQKPGGARYEARLSEEEVHAFENLILLCPTHHAIVDADEKSYPVGKMVRMKAAHEENHAHGKAPSDRVVNALQSAENQLHLVELRRPPEEILHLLKSRHVRRLSRASKLMIAGAIFYLLWFCVDVWYVSTVGLDQSSLLDILPSPAFLLLTAAFAHLSFVYYRRKVMVESEPPLMGKKRHHVRDLRLETDYNHLAAKCIKALHTTGGKLFEVVREDADRTLIYALRESGGFWARFTVDGLSLNELVITITREEGNKCLIRVETSVSDNSDEGVSYIAKFLDGLLK